MTDRVARRAHHERCGAWLENADDSDLVERVSTPAMLEVGYDTIGLPEDTHVFAKLVPMTALELEPRNRHVTANLFGLPPRYQVRIGSCGFGGWRELEIHRLVNEWVLSGECTGFPLLHHWRVLPLMRTGYDDRRDLRYWGDEPAIASRTAAVNAADSSLVLFLEHFPQTLLGWIAAAMQTASDPLSIVRDIERQLLEILAFTGTRGLLHLDSHFGNILTDGRRLYLTDFGLSVSRQFDLAASEVVFFEQFRDFDRCTAINSLVAAVVKQHAQGDWRQALRELRAGGNLGDAPADLRGFVLRRTPLAHAIGEFYNRFLADTTTPFPSDQFRGLLEALDQER